MTKKKPAEIEAGGLSICAGLSELGGELNFRRSLPWGERLLAAT